MEATEFRDVLAWAVAAAPGGRYAVLADPDGEAVDLFSRPDPAAAGRTGARDETTGPRLWAAHAGVVLALARRAAEGAAVGRVAELAIVFGPQVWSVHPLPEGYYLALGAAPVGRSAQVRRVGSLAAGRLAALL